MRAASKNDPRNHYRWVLGEPAYLKYWMRDSASYTSSLALRQEEGVTQEYVASCVRQYLADCGVVPIVPVRVQKDILQDDLVSEQWKILRVRPLPGGENAKLYVEAAGEPFALDGCPDPSQTQCY